MSARSICGCVCPIDFDRKQKKWDFSAAGRGKGSAGNFVCASIQKVRRSIGCYAPPHQPGTTRNGGFVDQRNVCGGRAWKERGDISAHSQSSLKSTTTPNLQSHRSILIPMRLNILISLLAPPPPLHPPPLRLPSVARWRHPVSARKRWNAKSLSAYLWLLLLLLLLLSGFRTINFVLFVSNFNSLAVALRSPPLYNMLW